MVAMLRSGSLAAALAVLFACSVSGLEPPLHTEHDEALITPSLQTYIVEYSTTARLQAKREATFLDNEIQVLTKFDSPVFSGAQIAATAGQTVKDITALPGVLRAWPDSRVSLLAPIAIREAAAKAEDAAQHDVHWATGVDELHRRGLYGAGVKIGVVDTGILYTHKALGGGFGPGFKVAAGHDFVGSGWTPGSPLNPSSDPIDEQGHGSHVAGIVAGNDSTTGWKGVAPAATLHAYKVFGATGSTDNSIVIAALLRAFDEGMDVITVSIGAPSGWADNALAVVANRIAAEGVVVTFAAGNSGAGGPFFADNGGTGEFVISVASADVGNNITTKKLQPSSFTSWGGLYDLSVKPDIAAPGRDVFSCWIGEDNNTFRLVSGTSMAAPYVAGVAALYLSSRKGVKDKDTAKHVASRIVASGSSLDAAGPSGVNKDFKASTFQVGTGIVNALNVIDSPVSIDLTRLTLKDTRDFQPQQGITLHNDGREAVTLNFSLESAGGYTILKDRDGTESVDEAPRIKSYVELSPVVAEATMSGPETLVLQPGESKKISFTFTAPNGLNATTLPLYSGKLIIDTGNARRLSVPYQGLAFDLYHEMDNMFAGTYPFLRAGFPPKDTSTFNFDLSTAVQSYPKIFSKLKWGTRELRWDIYEQGFTNDAAHWSYPPVVGEKGYVGSATSWASAGRVSQFNPAKHNASDLVLFPLQKETRNAFVSGSFTSTYYWFGKLASGDMVKPGNYTMRFAALKPFGDPAKSDDWSALTRNVTLTHKLGA